MPKRKNPAAQALGKIGGRARVARASQKELEESARNAAKARWKKVTPAERTEIAKRAAKARWAKRKTSDH